MSFSTTAPSIGDSTKQTDYARLMANNVYNKNFRESVSKSANYTVLDTDVFSLLLMTTADADKTVTLPTAADNTDRIIKLMKVDSGTGSCIVDGEGAETINGTTTWEITEQYGYIQIQCDGLQWFVIDQNDCCIYENKNTSNFSFGTSAWANEYSWSGPTAGIYKITFSANIRVSQSSYGYVTIATTTASEDDTSHTFYSEDSAVGTVLIGTTGSITFLQACATAPTFYINTKEPTALGRMLIYGTIRATITLCERIG